MNADEQVDTRRYVTACNFEVEVLSIYGRTGAKSQELCMHGFGACPVLDGPVDAADMRRRAVI